MVAGIFRSSVNPAYLASTHNLLYKSFFPLQCLYSLAVRFELLTDKFFFKEIILLIF
jgi:hypothetical protein